MAYKVTNPQWLRILIKISLNSTKIQTRGPGCQLKMTVYEEVKLHKRLVRYGYIAFELMFGEHLLINMFLWMFSIIAVQTILCSLVLCFLS